MSNTLPNSIYSVNDTTRYGYSYYEPKADNHQNPLIIWLHGAGEGGASGAEIPLYGTSKLGVLVDDEMQNRFGGAYVLVPQSPTMWMDAGGHHLTRDGSTIYNESLMEFIRHYVDSNPDIDRDRIYLGGCSNGGFMTMVLILENPDYFAAAFPVCEALFDRWISDEDILVFNSGPDQGCD
ncbi:MAG: prolyl oligopeptidase family serine peptidase [Muribaculaceae bacterium]|nr:prolyl oligopeptidase family serine peptidase [Muribaculaceae bacterium]